MLKHYWIELKVFVLSHTFLFGLFLYEEAQILICSGYPLYGIALWFSVSFSFGNYDYDDVYKENGKSAAVNLEKVKPGLWRCSICTYDNDESMSCCDICGVFRVPPSNSGNTDKETVEGKCKDSGASLLAKSLFASLPHQRPQKDVIFQSQNDHLVAVEGNKCHKNGINRREILEIRNALGSSHSCHPINIAFFKFDVPSPDDMVSIGLHSSKIALEESADVPSSIPEKIASLKTQSSARSTDGSMNFKGRFDTAKEHDSSSTNGGEYLDDTSNISRNKYTGKAPLSARKSDAPALMLGGKHDTETDNSSSAKASKTEGLASSLENISLKAMSGSTKHTIPAKASSYAEYKPDKWMLPEKGKDAVTQLNLVIAGNVDSGKSTLSGRLLHLLGQISQKEMHKYEKEAKLQGKGSFAYAWALDESAEERERGITMTVAVAYFDTQRYHVVVLDSPGHKDFVPNMISGAAQADAAILVVDASVGSFEAGMDSIWGQTREHAQIIRSFGVDQIIVAVNKMDTVEYSKERFEIIKQQVGSFLHSRGFKDSLVSWIPLSAMENQNLVAAASDIRLASWYRGPHLLEAIDTFHPPTRDYSKPLLMPICDIIKSQSMGQISACGKLGAGALQIGCKVLVMPLGDVGTVRSIECNSQPCPIARAGDNVAVSIQGIDAGHIMAGGVLCHPDFPVRVATHLELKVLVLDEITPILIGSLLEFHIHHAKEAARVVKIVSLLDPKTGKVTKKAPRRLVAKQCAVVEVVLQGSVCVEEFSNCKALGRAFLRASGRTISAGVVTRVIEDDK
ncbi:hypothetical protein Nepgr_001124 [Nepenthes gracilis]|uniref:HBS1-like protein n=1 Tax=Nepenthes gracilis TaxID=150966 RepID=A0AAD3RXI1_NEPGR|nr:hypothetical protein Nepgr_001124 [Nepenthes gracilis]